MAMEPNARAAPQSGIAEQKVVRVAVAEERGQGDAVVWRTGLLAEHVDVPRLRRAASLQRLHEPLGHHAGADDDELLLLSHEPDRRNWRFRGGVPRVASR